MKTRTASLIAFTATAVAAVAQYPVSSTLPRGEHLLTANPTDNNVIGWGYWRTVAPRERLPAGPLGTVPTAQVAYVTYMDVDAIGTRTVMFRRTIDGGLTWGAAQGIYTPVAGEVIDPAESRLVASGHEVFLVMATNRHTLVAGQQSVWALGSADQGQHWTAPELLSTDSLTTLRDVDEVNAACGRALASGPASLHVVFESDYNVPLSGVEDIYYVQAQIQGGNLVVTVPDTRLDAAVAPRASDVNFTAIAAQGPVVHVAWTDNRSGGGTSQYDYFSMTSRNDGTDWATTVEHRHTQFPSPLSWAAPRRPQVAVDLPNVYTFMEHSLNGQDDVWMDWSDDLGVTFAYTGIAINTATLGVQGDVDDMFVTASNGRVAVLYVDDRLNGVNDNDNNQAIVSVSNNGGMDFVNGTHVEVPLSLKDPNPIYGIEMVGDMIACVYETNCLGAEDMALSLSSDGGQSFQNYDVTSYGACGQFPSNVDVDDPRLALTQNGDAIVVWIDDRTPAGNGGGNTVNNVWTTGLHYPQLIDHTAAFQGLTYQDDSPNAAGNLCFVIISFTGTGTPITLDNLGFSINLSYDLFTDASILIALSSPPPNINQAFVQLDGTSQFPVFPNVSTLFGLPFWGAAFTITQQAQAGRFTDPIRFP